MAEKIRICWTDCPGGIPTETRSLPVLSNREGGGSESGIKYDNHVGPDSLPRDIISLRRPFLILAGIGISSHSDLCHRNQFRDAVQLGKTF